MREVFLTDREMILVLVSLRQRSQRLHELADEMNDEKIKTGYRRVANEVSELYRRLGGT